MNTNSEKESKKIFISFIIRCTEVLQQMLFDTPIVSGSDPGLNIHPLFVEQRYGMEEYINRNWMDKKEETINPTKQIVVDISAASRRSPAQFLLLRMSIELQETSVFISTRSSVNIAKFLTINDEKDKKAAYNLLWNRLKSLSTYLVLLPVFRFFKTKGSKSSQLDGLFRLTKRIYYDDRSVVRPDINFVENKDPRPFNIMIPSTSHILSISIQSVTGLDYLLKMNEKTQMFLQITSKLGDVPQSTVPIESGARRSRFLSADDIKTENTKPTTKIQNLDQNSTNRDMQPITEVSEFKNTKRYGSSLTNSSSSSSVKVLAPFQIQKFEYKQARKEKDFHSSEMHRRNSVGAILHRRKYSDDSQVLNSARESCANPHENEVFMVIEEEGKQEMVLFDERMGKSIFPNFSNDSSFEEEDNKISERVLLEETMEEDAGLASFHRESGMTPDKRKRKLSSEEQCDELVESLETLKGIWNTEIQDQSMTIRDPYTRSDTYKNGQVSGSIKVFHTLPEAGYTDFYAKSQIS